MSKAAVLTEWGRPLEVVDLKIGDLAPGEVRIRLRAAGVCGSDAGMLHSHWGPLPIVLGHEGAGVVEAVGGDVTSVAPGDHVIVVAAPSCGHCFFCDRGQDVLCQGNRLGSIVPQRNAGVAPHDLGDEDMAAFRSKWTLDGDPVYRFYWCGTFSDTVIVNERGAVKVDPELPFDVACLIGCGVVTGVGAARTVADIAEGDTVAVLGCGGVGLNVIQGARLQKAGRIVAIDVEDWKEDVARRFGATDWLNPGETDPVQAVRALTDGRGADVVFEVTHATKSGPEVPQQALDMTRAGGQLLLVGGLGVTLPAGFNVQLKTVKGVLMGQAVARRDYPELGRLYLAGELFLDDLISQHIQLDGVNEAFAAMDAGKVARSVIEFE